MRLSSCARQIPAFWAILLRGSPELSTSRLRLMAKSTDILSLLSSVLKSHLSFLPDILTTSNSGLNRSLGSFVSFVHRPPQPFWLSMNSSPLSVTVKSPRHPHEQPSTRPRRNNIRIFAKPNFHGVPSGIAQKTERSDVSRPNAKHQSPLKPAMN